jgi:hypothetical protein
MQVCQKNHPLEMLTVLGVLFNRLTMLTLDRFRPLGLASNQVKCQTFGIGI